MVTTTHAAAATATYKWSAAANGAVPNGAPPHGKEATGEPLYVARANFDKGVHPGKVRPGLRGARIPCNWNENNVTSYEVLMDAGSWVAASGGAIPAGAVEAGHEPDGTPLYVARAKYGDGVHPGKVRSAFGAAHIAWGGKELEVRDYEVLVAGGPGGFPKLANKTSGEESEERAGEYVCKVTHVSANAETDNHFALGPLSDILWPGAIIAFDSVQTGEYRPITDERGRLTLSCEDLPSINQPMRVDAPTQSRVVSAIAQAMKGASGKVIQAIFNVQQVYTEDQFMLALGANYKKGAIELTGSFDFADKSVKSKVLVDFRQIYYTVNVDQPQRPEDFYAKARQIGDEVYVASIDYGRSLIFLMQSSEEGTKLCAAAQVAVQGKGGGSVSTEYDKILKNAQIHVKVNGGGAEDGIKVITGGIQGVYDYINRGANFGPDSPAKPLSYRLRRLKDFALVSTSTTTEYNERNCVLATGKYDVWVENMRRSTAEFNKDYYGRIWARAFNDSGKPAGDETTVWEVGSGRPIKLSDKDKWVTVHQKALLRFDDLHKFKNTAYVELGGDLWQKERNPDHLRGESVKIYLKDVTDPLSGTIHLRHPTQNAEVQFKVEIVP